MAEEVTVIQMTPDGGKKDFTFRGEIVNTILINKKEMNVGRQGNEQDENKDEENDNFIQNYKPSSMITIDCRMKLYDILKKNNLIDDNRTLKEYPTVRIKNEIIKDYNNNLLKSEIPLTLELLESCIQTEFNPKKVYGGNRRRTRNHKQKRKLRTAKKSM